MCIFCIYMNPLIAFLVNCAMNASAGTHIIRFVCSVWLTVAVLAKVACFFMLVTTFHCRMRLHITWLFGLYPNLFDQSPHTAGLYCRKALA